MKLLILGNSNDTGRWVDEDQKRHNLIASRFSEEFGVPVDVSVRNTWPNERMVEAIEKAAAELQPDLVFVNITTFPFNYESLPLRVRRLFGRLGEPIGDAGMRLAGSKRWAHNRVFRGLRRFAQATIGGDTHFSVEDVVARYGELIRMLVRREGAVVVVKGPTGRRRRGLTRWEFSRHEQRRQQVHRAIRDVCAQARVPYFGMDEPRWKLAPEPKGLRAGDGTHANVAGAAYLADDHYRYIQSAWAEHVARSEERAAGVNGRPSA